MALWVVIFPIDLIKTNVQVQKRDEGIIQLAKLTYREQGFLGMYRGLTPTVVRTFPATGVLFMVYEILSNALTDEVKHNPRWEYLIKG